MERLRAWLGARVSACSLAALRIAYGILMLVATIRFAAMGWIDALYVEPSFHFTYYGFGWVHPWPAPILHAHFALLGVAALCVAVGLFYRVAIIVFTLLFAYVELLDVTTYLNHYYAITLVGVLLAFTPASNVMSVDAWLAERRGRPLSTTVPRAAIVVFRAQLAVIYFFAGVAKLGSDWLLHAEPMTTWLLARSDLAIVGPWLAQPWVAFAMSWVGAAFDLTISVWLSIPRTRPYAYAVVVVFHLATAMLFPIGMFPWVMIGLTPIFFAPDWPHRGRKKIEAGTGAPLSLGWTLAIGAWLALQIALPLRHYVYAGDVLYTEEGFRYAWLVMIVERQGMTTFRVVGDDGIAHEEAPDDLTQIQRRMMATQPDLILAYAHHLRDAHAAHGEHVRVYADAFVSTNGHRRRRLVDPSVDLAAQEDSLFGFSWVLTENDPAGTP
jgi:vitamin K-dependent gamma-carboxylase